MNILLSYRNSILWHEIKFNVSATEKYIYVYVHEI